MAAAVAIVIFASTLLICAGICLNWLWLKPKKLEKQLRQHGFQGNSYRFWYGDKKEEMSMAKARSKSIPLHHDIAPRILPFLHKHVPNYGMYLVAAYLTQQCFRFMYVISEWPKNGYFNESSLEYD